MVRYLPTKRAGGVLTSLCRVPRFWCPFRRGTRRQVWWFRRDEGKGGLEERETWEAGKMGFVGLPLRAAEVHIMLGAGVVAVGLEEGGAGVEVMPLAQCLPPK